MNTHEYPNKHYITKIVINNEYHGDCFMKETVPSCEWLDCTVYHNRIATVDGTMNVDVFYGDDSNWNPPCDNSALAKIVIEPFGTRKYFFS